SLMTSQMNRDIIGHRSNTAHPHNASEKNLFPSTNTSSTATTTATTATLSSTSSNSDPSNTHFDLLSLPDTIPSQPSSAPHSQLYPSNNTAPNLSVACMGTTLTNLVDTSSHYYFQHQQASRPVASIPV